MESQVEQNRLRNINTMTTEVSPKTTRSNSTLDDGKHVNPQNGSGDHEMPPADITKPFLDYMREAGESFDQQCSYALEWVLHHETVDPESVSAQMLTMMQNIRSGWTKTKDLEVNIEKSKFQLEHVKNAKILKLKALGGNGTPSQLKALDGWVASKTKAIEDYISATDKECHLIAEEAELILEELVKYVGMMLHPDQVADDAQQSPEVNDLVKELDTLFSEQIPECGDQSLHDNSGVMTTKPPHMVAMEHISALPDGQTKTALMALCEANMVSTQDIGGYFFES